MTTESPGMVSLEGYLAKDPDFSVLYKYQSINEYSLDALEKSYVYFSSRRELNDPFDPFISFVSNTKNIIDEINKAGPKVFCLTTNCNNAQMWGHYGNSNAGMCIGYAVFTGNPRLVNPMQYISKLPENVNLYDLLTIKHESWKLEEEWRAVLGQSDNKVFNLFYPVSIHLGSKCTHEDMLKVKKVKPDTVEIFDIKYPSIVDKGFQYIDYSVEDIIKKFGKLPSLEGMIKNASSKALKQN